MRAASARAKAAHARGDIATLVLESERASDAFPGHPRAAYNLACAYALAGRKDDAFRALDAFLALEHDVDLRADADLAGLIDDPRFAALETRQKSRRAPVVKSQVFFRIPDADFLSEGIAYDEETHAFYVGSVHQRKIVRRSEGGIVADFVSASTLGPDFHGPLGLAVDAKRRTLWVCTTALPEMRDFRESDRGNAALHAIDISSGQRKAIVRPSTQGPHNFNDLALDPNGDVFFSDAAAGEIEIVRAGSTNAETFVARGTFVSPQGLVLDRETTSLFVADYARGLARIDLEKRDVTFFEPPDGGALVGIDGLVRAKRNLLAIQNGVVPARVIELRLSRDGKRLEGRRVLERAHPEYEEPTLGVVVGDRFYYVANAQWDAFSREGAHRTPRAAPTILEMPLVR
jgi:sugar lactone lactonase YvrE